MVAPSETTPLLAQDGGSSAADDFDSRFRRWKEAVRQRFRKGKQRQNDDPQWLISVFGGGSDGEQQVTQKGEHSSPPTSSSQIARDIQGVRQAISEGIQPTMIQTGSSGSYFVKAIDAETGKPVIKAVFKPSDEEPYGNLNPKRRFLRRYFWWAMGRPCLIPGFSAMSEAAASLLDDQLNLGLVPKTQLVNLSSPAFHYHYNDRRAWEEHGQPLPEKVGSFQSFLHGYTMASSFLRRNPFPTRPRSILERDLAAEQLTHRKMRKREKARLRKCGVRLKYFLLCRQGVGGDEERGATAAANGNVGEAADGADEASGREDDDDTFLWTADLLHSFRLELEKLVVFDYLCRNTDRGLDNFMVRHMRASEASGDRIKLGAIDNSLAWPIKHPDGIRDYPFGWLFLPMDIIGGPFHRSTKEHFLPLLASPKWWRETELELRKLFEQDEHFSEKLFESQMAVFKGQGWNVVQALRSDDEGPIELCARQKKVVHQSTITVSKQEVSEFEGGKVPLQASVAVSDLVSRQPRHPAPQVTAPIGIASGGKEASPSPSLGADVHPRSLPETSRIVLPDTPLQHPHQQPRPLELGSSLGIDVLKDLDRAARKTRRSQRPAFQKAVSGFDLGRKQPLHSPQQHRGSASARSGVAAPHHHHRRGLSSNDVLSEVEDDDDLLDEEGGGASTRGRSSPTPAAEARLAQSDYFASYAGAGAAGREPMQSIDSALAAASRGDISPVQQRGSYDSTPPAALTSRPTKNRRRMRSVGNWSLLSSDAGQGDEAMTPAATAAAAVVGGMHTSNGGRDGGGDSDEQIKVIVERIIDVDAQPWQSWLRA